MLGYWVMSGGVGSWMDGIQRCLWEGNFFKPFYVSFD